MADCLADLILRPGINPPVQIGLTVVAGVDTLSGGEEPGEVDGHPVPAILVRELAHALGLLPRPDEPERVEPEAATEPEPAAETTARDRATEPARRRRDRPDDRASRVRDAETTAATEPAEAAIRRVGPTARAGRRERPAAGRAPMRRPRRGWRRCSGCAAPPAPRWRTCRRSRSSTSSPGSCSRSPTPPASGTPRPAAGRSAAPGNGPAPTRREVPGSAHRRTPTATAPRLRWSGSCAPATGAAGSPAAAPPRSAATSTTTGPGRPGPTSADNLCCLCRHHHRLSHQAPGWTMTRLADGGLRWTTPGGDTITTHPPRYGTDDDLPPPTVDPPTHRPDRDSRSASSNTSAAGPPNPRTRTTPHPSEVPDGPCSAAGA